MLPSRLLVPALLLNLCGSNLNAVLLYPKGTLIQFTIGVSVPISMSKRGNLAFNVAFQFNYALPSNLSELEPTTISSRRARELQLRDIYAAIENTLNQVTAKDVYPGNELYLCGPGLGLNENCHAGDQRTELRRGWQDGRECLLRTICSLAEAPLHRTRQDTLQEIIHLVLTPTEDLPETRNSSHQAVDELYQEAEQLGRSGGDCVLAYPDCIESPLESFTEIVFPEGA